MPASNAQGHSDLRIVWVRIFRPDSPMFFTIPTQGHSEKHGPAVPLVARARERRRMVVSQFGRYWRSKWAACRIWVMAIGGGDKWARDIAIVRYWGPRWGLPMAIFTYAQGVFRNGPVSFGRAVYGTVVSLVLGIVVSYCVGLTHDRLS
jgi:hypothetical protein